MQRPGSSDDLCQSCPYLDKPLGLCKQYILISDALSLIKGDDPREMSFDELVEYTGCSDHSDAQAEGFVRAPLWTETPYGASYRGVNNLRALVSHSCDAGWTYGVDWVCWNKKPPSGAARPIGRTGGDYE